MILDQAVCSQCGAQSLEQGMDQQTHLDLAHIVFGLRLLQGVPAQLLGVARHDLFT